MIKKIMVLAIIVVFAGYFLRARFFKEEEIPPSVQTISSVKTMIIENESSVSDRTYAGVVSPRNKSRLAFQIGGKISERLVEMGDHVEKGQMLMKLDPEDANLNLDAVRAMLEKTKSDSKLAHTNLGRYQNLLDKGAVSQAKFEEMQNDYNAAESALKQAQANFDEATRKLEFTELKAEHDGVIVDKRAEVAQVVAAGETVLIVQQGDELDIEINVPEQRVGDFRSAENMEISVAIPAIEVKDAPADVRDISPQADPASRTYAVKISPVSKIEGMADGMTASVNTLWRGENSLLSVPVSALYRTDGQPDCVWVVSGDMVFKRAVQLGEFAGDSAQVLSGLSAGDEIVVAGVLKIEEGQKVKRWTGTSE